MRRKAAFDHARFRSRAQVVHPAKIGFRPSNSAGRTHHVLARREAAAGLSLRSVRRFTAFDTGLR